VVKRRPVRHQVRVRDQHPRRVRVRAKHTDWFSGLHAKRLVGFEITQSHNNAIKAFPVAGGAADAAIDHKLVRLLCHFGIKVVHQHPQRRFSQPAPGGKFWAARCADDASIVEATSHRILFRSEQTQGRLRAPPAKSAGWA
jgi:hypothetical protein